MRNPVDSRAPRRPRSRPGKEKAPETTPAKANVDKRKKAAPAQDKLTAMGIEGVCTRIVDGVPLRAIAEAAGVSKGTLITWLAGHPDRYARARETLLHIKAEELEEIGERAASAKTAAEVAGLRLLSDNRKWLLSKLAPRKYGDKLAVGGADDLPPVRQEVTTMLDPTEAYQRMLGRGASS
jgi:hypothetical protein